MDDRKWHNIRPNEQNRIPVRHVFIDTEAKKEHGREVEFQEWRCACATYATRKRTGEYATYDRDYVDPETLWRDVSDFASGDGRTIVWCHNLAYDVRISDLFTVLPSLGWALNGHNISPRGTWLEWRRDGRTMVLCDSVSVFPAGIEQVGKWFGMAKPPLPREDSGMAEWLNRCRADTRILTTAVLGYLEWLKNDDMGNWQITGNAQAWAAFRHKFYTHKLTVHSDREALDAERRAMWAGRCEAYWHGKITGITILEYDYVQSYPTIARDYEVPVKLLGVIENPDAIWKVMRERTAAMLVECTVETEVPVVPAEHEGRILWPVGRFRTTLWDVEVRAAIEAGAEVTVHRGWAYRTAPALRAWGEWILGRLGEDDQAVPAWMKAVLKHWSRSLIGRMAMTYQSWDYDGEVPWSRIESGYISEGNDGKLKEYIQIGNRMWLHAGKVEWQHSMPMVTGYIQAIARVQLWDILRQMPKGAVLYADTDSVYITEVDREELEALIAKTPNCTLRIKNAWESIEIHGPRQIVTGAQARISGIPKTAKLVEKGKFKGEIWESIGTALTMGRINRVQVKDRTWSIAGIDNRRRATDNGFTEAIRIGS